MSAELLLRKLLDDAGGGDGAGTLLVMDAEGLENLPASMSTPKGVYAVHRVGTEIGLRHLLWKAGGAPLIAVLPEPLAHRIQRSPDLLRRADRQRVFALSITDVLEAVLGVRVVGADTPYMQQLALENVRSLERAMTQRTLPTVVDRRLLQELLIDASLGERVRKQTPGELLAAWVGEAPAWFGSDNLRKLLVEALPTLHGDEGLLLAWAAGDPGTRMREMVVRGAVLTVDAEDVPKAAWGPLWKAAEVEPLKMDRRILRRTVTRLAESALEALRELKNGEKTLNALLDEASTVARECVSPRDVATSHVLPLAFEDRASQLATRAAAGKPIAASELAWLASHRAATTRADDLRVLEAMARLSRWLAEPAPSATDVVTQVVAYQRSGAFADRALAHLAQALASSRHHHVEARKLADACRARRDEENRAFAATLARGYEAALYADGVTPLPRLWKRVVAPVWNAEPSARLFLVVLDGCSYPVFLELLHELAQSPTFPLGIRPDGEGRVAGLPAISPLPTITSHARGSIFLGELPQDPLVAETVFRDEQEAKTDAARFRQNAALGTRTRRLFLKGDLSGGVHPLLTALRDDGLGVVGVVFNAVDDQIGSSNTGAAPAFRAATIHGLIPALQVAIESGRKVLFTADHGHSRFVDAKLRVGAGSTPRYLALEPGQAPPDGFVEIDVGGLGGPPQRRAFAVRSGVYLGGQQVGFHGGASLEEMVVPLAWIERDGLAADEPSWWFGPGAVAEGREARPISPPIVTPVPSEPMPARPKPQLSLFDPADKAEILPLTREVLDTLSRDERAVLVLLRESSTARASELAERLGKNAGRFNGLMVSLRRKLHDAGHVMFAIETLATGETMYRYQAPEKAR